MRYPIEENSDDNEVKACSDDEDGNTANNSGESAKKQWKYCIKQTESDHHITHIVDTPSAGYVSL